MKEKAIGKIKGFGKAGCIISNFLKVVVILGMVVLIGCGILFMVLPKDFIKLNVAGKAKVEVDMGAIGVDVDEKEIMKDTEGTLSIDDAEYEIADVKIEDDVVKVDTEMSMVEITLKECALAMLLLLVKLVAIFVVVVFFGRLCKAVRDCETPFEDGVINGIKNIGYSMIPMTFLSSIEDSISNSFMSGKLDIYVNIELTLVVAILLVFALAYIFSYGAILQQESDETL